MVIIKFYYLKNNFYFYFVLVRTVYVPVVVYIPVAKEMADKKSNENAFNNCIQRPTSGSIIISKHKSPKKVKKIGQLKHSNEQKRKSAEITRKREQEPAYYQTAFISNPCEQLFGPDLKNSAPSINIETAASSEQADYIPTPKWSKAETHKLEELYRKGRFPNTTEIKTIAQQLKVMDSDVEEWFRKRRGRDRKTRRKNDNLKSLIDNYLDH